MNASHDSDCPLHPSSCEWVFQVGAFSKCVTQIFLFFKESAGNCPFA